MIRRLPRVRTSTARRRLRTERTNVGELRRLLAPYRLALGRRTPGLPLAANPALLRVARGSGRGWHWAVAAYGYAFDPARARPIVLANYVRRVGRQGLTWYPVATVDGTGVWK